MDARIVDTHCHIQFEQYDADRQEVIGQAKDSGTGMLIVGCDYSSSEGAIRLAQEIGDGAWASLGQHPNDSREDFDYARFLHLGHSSSKVVAVGETGLDWYRLPEGIDVDAEKMRQQNLFAEHIKLSKELSKPLIIHSRDAHTELIGILQSSFGPWRQGDRERGVLHCFTGTVDDAREYLALGFLISFTGIITFARQYDNVVCSVSLEKILVETDAPFLTPVPFRGKRNTPHYVEYIGRRIAELKEISFEDVARQTTHNAQRLFELI